MEALLLAFSPFLVKWVIDFVKPLKNVNVGEEGSLRKNGIRALVAILSLGSAVGVSMLSSEGIDVESLSGLTTTAVETVLVFLSATGVYFFEKRKKEEVK